MSLLQLSVPVHELLELLILVAYGQNERGRCGAENRVVRMVGTLLVGVVCAQRADKVNFGGYDPMVLEVVHYNRAVMGAAAFVSYLVILRLG